MLKKTIIVFIILGLVYNCFAQESYFANLYNIKSHPLAMGGAFTSVQGDLESIAFNPGSFSLYQYEKDFRITLFLNPISSLVAFQKYSDNFQHKINQINFWHASALLVKAILFTYKSMNTGIMFSEELINNIYNHHSLKWFEINDLWNNSANTFFTCFQLAERLSIGFSSTLYFRRNSNEIIHGFGLSYGVLLKPSNKLNVGLSYLDFPDNMPDVRLLLERMTDEAMNIGVSYKPTQSTIFSLDIRNLTEENKENVRELHFGFEQSMFKIAAIRFGFFKERFSLNKTYSVGIGLVDSNLFFNEKNYFRHHDFIINYSFIYQDRVEKFIRWHFFSLVFRI